MTAATVAAFDVDGTLTTRDCVVPFIRRISGAPRVAARLLARPDRLIAVLARRDRDALKELAARAAFSGRRYDDLSRRGVDFAALVHRDWIRPDTLNALRAHLAAGDRVVLVSASFEVYLRPLGQLLGVHHVLGTRLQIADGAATGELDGPNCRGPEKVRRLHAWLLAECGGRNEVRLVAYGDSAGDREMLADADEAHWITPLEKAA
jgi:phosphatidylglycerophosphatase C